MLQLRKQLRPLADLGQISDREFWLKVLQAVGIKAAADDWQIDHYEKAINGAIEIAKSLKQKGYRIAILSNDAKESSDLRRTKHHFDEIFDAIIISCHYGVIKPNPEIYRFALNKLKALPEQSLFIDDRMENIESSRNLGINSILFTNIDLLIEELKQLGINFD
jgi:epoxide hydrolase-like predicted phosphatase